MGDYIAGQSGDDGRNTIIGKGNRQSAKDIRATGDYIQRDQVDLNRGNQVRVEVGADAVSQQRDRIEDQIQHVATNVERLSRALIGDPRYGTTGLVHQVEKMDRWRVFSLWALILICIFQLVEAWFYYALYSGLSQRLIELGRDVVDLSHQIAK